MIIYIKILHEIENKPENNLSNRGNLNSMPNLNAPNLNLQTGLSSLIKKDFKSAFGGLSVVEKKYFNILQNYALDQPKARLKPNKYDVAIGVGNTDYIRMFVKYNTLIARFNNLELKITSPEAVTQAKQEINEIVAELQSKKNNH